MVRDKLRLQLTENGISASRSDLGLRVPSSRVLKRFDAMFR